MPIEFAPSVQQYCVLKGSTATITCETSSSEEAEWFMNEAPLVLRERFETVREGSQHHLIIHDVTFQDAAQFSLHIGGERHALTQLIVEGNTVES